VGGQAYCKINLKLYFAFAKIFKSC